MTDIGKAFQDFAQAVARQHRMTHAAIVIASAAILETQLERALKRAMQPLSKKAYKRLFDAYGPLSTFANKIVMAHALGIVPFQVYQDLEKLRRIRNAFAHSSEILSFSSAEVIPLFQAIQRPERDKRSAEAVFLAFVEDIDAKVDEYLKRLGDRPS